MFPIPSFYYLVNGIIDLTKPTLPPGIVWDNDVPYYYRSQSGLLQLSASASDYPLEYLNNTPVGRALITPAAENRLVDNTIINTSTKWLVTELTKTNPSVSGPAGMDGFVTSLVPTTTTDQHQLYSSYTGAANLKAGTTHTISIFLKADGYSNATLAFQEGGSSHPVFIDLANGTASQNSPAPWPNISLSSYSDGWYRASIKVTLQENLGNITFRLYVTDANGNQSFAGDGIKGLLVWLPQMVGLPVTTGPFAVIGQTPQTKGAQRLKVPVKEGMLGVNLILSDGTRIQFPYTGGSEFYLETSTGLLNNGFVYISGLSYY